MGANFGRAALARDEARFGRDDLRAGDGRLPRKTAGLNLPSVPTFTARIGKNWIMRCVIVPVSVMKELGGGTRISVLAAYAGEKHLTTVMPAGRGRGRLTVLADILRAGRLDVGDRIEVTLTRSLDPREPAVPADLQRALQFRPAAREAFEQGPASLRRAFVNFIEQARRAETRQAYIEVTLERLTERAQRQAKRKS